MAYFNDSELPIIGTQPQQDGKIEVCRSFSYKLNLANHGGPQYESADFFASRKMECAAADAQWVSEQIYEECVQEVRDTVARFIAEMQRKRGGRERSVA